MRSADCGVWNAAVHRSFVFGSIVALSVVGLRLCFSRADEKASYKTETVRGRAVFLAEAFEKQTGIATVPEARDRVLALQTAEGTLVPLLEDARCRAFRSDERLRRMDLELTVRRYRTSPVVQIIRVLEVAEDGRYEIDYWCDICAISLVEKRECDCCQGPVELRRRKVID